MAIMETDGHHGDRQADISLRLPIQLTPWHKGHHGDWDRQISLSLGHSAILT